MFCRCDIDMLHNLLLDKIKLDKYKTLYEIILIYTQMCDVSSIIINGTMLCY